MKYKIYDCFLYNDEELILNIRLNILNKFIKKFIIIESKFDHQGNKKKLSFDIKKFLRFKKKIIYLVIEEFPKNFSNWKRENFQRNFIANALTKVNKEEYVMISDVDEIPNLSNIQSITNHKYTVFEQKMFYYKINLINKTYPIWFGSRICKKKYLKSPQWLRDQKIKKYPFWRFYKIRWNVIREGGWHFSFLMTPQQIEKKINSWAHAEFNNKKYKDLKKIKDCLKNKKDLFNREIILEKISFDKTFPKYLKQKATKYKKWII